MSNEAMREGFEKWASDDYKWPRAIQREGEDSRDHYALAQTQAAWNTWQAAWNAAIEASARVADHVAYAIDGGGNEYVRHGAAVDCAARIRRLKEGE